MNSGSWGKWIINFLSALKFIAFREEAPGFDCSPSFALPIVWFARTFLPIWSIPRLSHPFWFPEVSGSLHQLQMEMGSAADHQLLQDLYSNNANNINFTNILISIRAIQEHWLQPPYKKQQGVNQLRYVHPNFDGYGVSAMSRSSESKVMKFFWFHGNSVIPRLRDR